MTEFLHSYRILIPAAEGAPLAPEAAEEVIDAAMMVMEKRLLGTELPAIAISVHDRDKEKAAARARTII